MFLPLFQRLSPFGIFFLNVFLVCIMVMTLLIFTWYGDMSIQVDPRNSPQCLVPDFCVLGYRPAYISTWYNVIGDQGRATYRYIAILDLLVLIPSYVLTLESFLITGVKPDPEWWLYSVPLLAALFDWIESLTHLVATNVLYPQLPPVWLLQTASTATSLKWLSLLASVVLFLYESYKIQQQKRQQQPLELKEEKKTKQLQLKQQYSRSKKDKAVAGVAKKTL